jgi:hypothetical protein
VRAILEQWDDADPRQPAEITFYVEKREEMNLTVAGYRYREDPASERIGEPESAP